MDELTRRLMESPFPKVIEGSASRISTPPRRLSRSDAPEPGGDREVARPREVVRPDDRALSTIEVIPRDRSEVVTRLLNFSIAALGLAIVLPLCVVIAVLTKLTSRGPVLYAQTRVGRDRRWRDTLALHERRVSDLGGEVFTIYKFRTMRVNAERFSGVVWAQEHDPRVTRLGRQLRMLRFDELPQLWNVLRGDMNMVGPRPERPSIVARLREVIPEYRDRLRVKPGITGLAQINQKYDACIDDVRAKVTWDLEYIQRQSLWVDTKIMARTVPAVLLKFRGW